jgi:hypothetical protein
MQPLVCRGRGGLVTSTASMITGVLPMGSFCCPPHLVRFIESNFLRLARARG